MDNLTVEETLRLSALQLAIDSIDKAPLVVTNKYPVDFGDMIVARAEKFYEFLASKIEKADEES